MGATGKWTQAGVPHKGWTCVDIEDLGSPDHVCEMCEVQPVRYVHSMEHPNHETLRVGCVCAGAFWSARIKHRDTGWERKSKRFYATGEHAKLAAFDAMVARVSNTQRRVIPMIVYCLAPIDEWIGWNHKNDVFKEIITEELAYEFRDIEEWNRLWAQASELGRQVGWEGDIREGPYVSMLPNPGGDPQCSVLIAWKQDNNGTTFVASPYRLPWLDEGGWVRWIDVTDPNITLVKGRA
jgi:hypothetical protein